MDPFEIIRSETRTVTGQSSDTIKFEIQANELEIYELAAVLCYQHEGINYWDDSGVREFNITVVRSEPPEISEPASETSSTAEPGRGISGFPLASIVLGLVVTIILYRLRAPD